MLIRTRSRILTIAAATAMLTASQLAHAQQPAAAVAATPAPAGPVVNDAAPDFTLQGADRYGVLKTPVRLSDFRGSTVVLAFFYQARTKG
ncbi:MAG TPA: hypothetical protein VK481_07170 [Gemmatimonadaceae bacterium]|nr:hypothetical protein [Gemmatimonadaceae bacterium]